MKPSLESQCSIPKEIMAYYYFSTDRICTVADAEDSKKSDEEEKFADYQCYICYEISLNIQECKTCERIFCNRCIDDITKSKPPGTEVPCPNNCVPWALDKPHRSVRNAIETIEFYCVNHSKGCSLKLKVHNAEQHIQNECEYTMVHCLNEGCVKEMLRKDLKKHFEEECQLRKVTCEKCQILSKFSEASKHNCVTSLKEVISVQKAEIDRLNEIIAGMYTQDQVNAILKGKDIEQKEQKEEVVQKEENINKKDNLAVQQEGQQEKKKELGQEEGQLKKENSNPDDKDEQDNQNKKKENPFQKLFQLGMKFIHSSREQYSQAQLPQLQQSQPQQLPSNPYPQKAPAAQSYAYNQVQAPVESQYNQFQGQQQQQQQLQQQEQQVYPFQNPQPFYQQQQQQQPQYPEYSKPQQAAVPSGSYQQYNPYNNQPANSQNAYYTLPYSNSNNNNGSSYSSYYQQNKDYSYSNNNNYSINNPNGTFFYSPPVSNNYRSQQPLLLNQAGCDHSNLQPIHSVYPANKICKCNQFLEKDYYFCQNCQIYMCPKCKK